MIKGAGPDRLAGRELHPGRDCHLGVSEVVVIQIARGRARRRDGRRAKPESAGNGQDSNP